MCYTKISSLCQLITLFIDMTYLFISQLLPLFKRILQYLAYELNDNLSETF